MKNSRIRLVSVAVALLAGAFTICLADQVVYFSNGKAMMVKSIEKGDSITILEIDGGGRIGVPTAQIVKIEEYALSKQEPKTSAVAQQKRAAAPAVPARPAGAQAPQPNAAANLVADAPSIVPVKPGTQAPPLADQRQGAAEASRPAGESGQAARRGGQQMSAGMAAAMAARQGAASPFRGPANSKLSAAMRGRGHRAGVPRGQALISGTQAVRPGQESVNTRGAAQPPTTQAREENVEGRPNHSSYKKGTAAGKRKPPAGKGNSEPPPSEAH